MRALILFLFLGEVVGARDFEQTWRGERLTIRIRAAAVGNLTWQLDTLSGHTNTKPKDYEDLWRKDLAWTAEDANFLNQWSLLYNRNRRDTAGKRRMPPIYPHNYARYYGNSVSRDYAFRIAALNAADLSTLRRSYRKLCGRACAENFINVLSHFWPRFSTWWQQEGLASATKIIPQLAAKTADFGLGAISESVIRLTAAEVPQHHEVNLDVVVHPKKYLTNYTATAMENHILTEVVDDPEIGGPRLPLVLHELTHHFYDSARRGRHIHLVESFDQRPEPFSLAAYSILNEALATAVQLLAEKHLRPPSDYAKFIADDDNVYFDPFISKVGRALAPIVEDWIAANKNIFQPDFADAYLPAVAAALGPLRESPRFLLSSRVLIHWAGGKRAKDEFVQMVRGITTLDEWRDLMASPNLGGVVFATQNDFTHLQDSQGVLPQSVLAAVTEAARTQPAFAYAWQRSPKAAGYILYGRDEERLLRVTKSFARSDTAFSGLRLAQTH